MSTFPTANPFDLTAIMGAIELIVPPDMSVEVKEPPFGVATVRANHRVVSYLPGRSFEQDLAVHEEVACQVQSDPGRSGVQVGILPPVSKINEVIDLIPPSPLA